MSSIANWEQYKEQYGDTVVTILPEDEDLTSDFPYLADSQQPGAAFNQSVETSIEHGVTFNNDGSGFDLRASIDSVIQMARLGGSEIAMTGRIPYATAAQSKNPGRGKAGRAFFSALELKQTMLAKGGSFYRELMTWYGCGTATAAAAHIGVINASVSGADLAAGQVVNITRASWNGAIWLMLAPTGKVDVYQADATTLRAADVVVTTRDESLNRITLSKSGSAVVVAATDIIVMPGARLKQCYGVQPILENTGSLFGIDAAATPVWKPLQFNAAGQLTISKIRACGTRLKRNGLTKGATVRVGAEAFGDLCDELENDQEVTDDRAARVMGPSTIKVRTSAGEFMVKDSLYCKQGIGVVIGKDSGAKRVGAMELGFDISNLKGSLETPVSGAAAYELRMYGQNAPFIHAMAHCAMISGITSASDTLPA
jgi:hypothetical protein